MNKSSVFRIVTILLMVFVTLVAPGRAYANTIERFEINFDFTTFSPGEENACGFDYTYNVYGTYRVNLMYDENGLPTRSIDIWGNLKYEMYANGKTVSIQIQGPMQIVHVSEDTMLVKYLGAANIVTLPGEGKVYGGGVLIVETWTLDYDTGEWQVETTKQAGNLDNSGWDLVCQYLAS